MEIAFVVFVVFVVAVLPIGGILISDYWLMKNTKWHK